MPVDAFVDSRISNPWNPPGANRDPWPLLLRGHQDGGRCPSGLTPKLNGAGSSDCVFRLHNPRDSAFEPGCQFVCKQQWVGRPDGNTYHTLIGLRGTKLELHAPDLDSEIGHYNAHRTSPVLLN